MIVELLASDMPRAVVQDGLRARFLATRARRSASRASHAARSRAADVSHPAMAVNLDACIQCTRCVRACREEQVNDVIGYAFRGVAFEDRVRSRRSDGPLDVRRVRRMRAGVPDRRARARARRVPAADRPQGRVGVPVLRRRLPDHVQHPGQPDRARRRARRPREPRAALRQGPLRLRLRQPPASADEAADPQAGLAEVRRFHRGPGEPAVGLPRGDVGRGAGAGRRRARAHPRHARPATRSPDSARPRAATRRRTCSRSWCAPASARTTSTTARGSATRRASRRCSKASAPARCPTR